MKWRRLAMVAIILLFSMLTFAMPATQALRISGPSDCDDNAIVHCGVHTITEVVNAYDSSAYVRQVYSAFGISRANIHNLANTAVAGRVTSGGRVLVDGQTAAVATGAITGGRQNMPGSTKVAAGNTVFYKRPPSVSFQSSSLPAFVAMENGKFQFAIIASCGNAVAATAVVKPKPSPAPQTQAPVSPTPPAPAAPVQQQQQQQQTTVLQQTTVTPTPTPAPQAPAPASAPAKPTTLVDTGAGSVVGLFSLTSALGIIGYRRWLTHHLANSSSL